MDIRTEMQTNAYALQAILDTAIGDAHMSKGWYGTVIHLADNATVAQQTKAQAIIDNYGELSVTSDTVTMTDLQTATITCADATIASDADVGYVVLLDGQVYASGDSVVSAGNTVLTFVAPPAGSYDVYLYRKASPYQSGNVSFTVTEA